MTSYVAFIPLGLLLLLYFAVRKPRQIIILTLSFLGAFFLITKAFYGSPEQYLSSLPACMNLGEKNMPALWAGKSAAPDSPFFASSYALSWVHAKEAAFMYDCAGGVAFIPLLGWLLIRNSRTAVKELVRGYTLLGFLIVGWFLFYLLFMVPKLGLVRDCDLFFGTYITIAFFTGHLFDKWPILNRSKTLACVMGNTWLSFYLFSVAGIRPIGG